MRCELVAGRAAGRGLAGIYDPLGLDPLSARRDLESVLGEGVELLGHGKDATTGAGVLLDGELFDADGVDERSLAESYGRRGTAMLERLRGSFAFVAWDPGRHRGLIAIDQLGSHSLYFASAGSRLLFASEARLVLGLLPRRPGPNPAALVHWLAKGTTPDGTTLFEGLLRLSGGECVELDGGWTKRSYWFLRYEHPDSLTRSEATARLWDVLVGAVRRRMSDGSPIGIIMSGGVDSSAVAAAATAVAGKTEQPLRGYSAIFPRHRHPRVDESEQISELTGALRLPSAQVDVRATGALALALDYLEAWELPLSGPGYMIERPLLELAAGDGVTALLDGQGGDELFGLSGYLLADRLRSGRVFSSVRLARSYPGIRVQPRRMTGAVWRYFALHGAVPHRVHKTFRRLRAPERYVPHFLNAASARLYLDSDDSWEWKQRRGVPRWWAYKADAITRSRSRMGIGEYLRHRAALAGLRARPPLFDVDLIELALRIPPEFDFDPDLDRPLIREALRGRVPDSVRLSVRKSNLAPFYFDDVSGPDIEPIRRILRAADAELGAYVDLAAVRRLVDDPPAVGEANWLGWMSTVWYLVAAECWLRCQADAGFVERLRLEGLSEPMCTVQHAVKTP